MSDLLTKEYYDKILSDYITEIEKIEDKLTEKILDNIQHPRKGKSWKLQEAEIHNYYELLYNLSVDSLEKGIEKVNSEQITKQYLYMVKRYEGKEFQFSTQKEIETYASAKIASMTTIYESLLAEGKISQATLTAINRARKNYQKLFEVSETQAKRVIAVARGTGLSEVTVETMISEGLATGKVNTVSTAVTQLSKGQFLAVIGKDGIARHFKPSYIINSFSRDIFHQNQAEVTKQSAKEYGFKLYKISTHNTRTELCQYYEGGTFAVDEKSSKETGFPVLDMFTPFHYGCLHNMLLEDYDFLKMKGEVEQTKAFSNQLVNAKKDGSIKGITKKPVYPTGYTKPADRPTISVKQEAKTKKDIAKLEKQKSKSKTDDERQSIDNKIEIRENRLKAGGVS